MAKSDKQKTGSRSLGLPLLLVLILAGAGYAYTTGLLEPGSLKPALDSAVNSVRSLLGMPVEPEKPLAQAKPQPQSPKIDMNKPVGGTLNGSFFHINYSEIRDGILTLAQGKADAPVRELKVFLFTKKGVIPEGQTYTNKNGPDGFKPHIHIAWKDKDEDEQQRKSFTDNYDLRLEFGKVSNDRLPGKILVKLPSAKTQVVGKFVAKLEGFRLINGVPDLRGDANETLVYLALEHLLKDDPGKPIQDVMYKNVKYTEPSKSGRPQTGSLEMVYRLGDEQPVAEFFTFIKEKQGWRVSRR